MSYDFGFEPTNAESGYYFISYNTEDGERIAGIAKRLHALGLPMWYDKGIKPGEFWTETITRKIAGCREFILFVTNGIFKKGYNKKRSDIFTYKEYKLADFYSKKILIVYLDPIDENELPDSLVNWYLDLKELQGLYLVGLEANETADKIRRETRDSPIPTHSETVSLELKDARLSPNETLYDADILLNANELLKCGKDEEAINYIIEAISYADPTAMVLLGDCYYEGRFFTKNYERAVFWYDKSANLNNADAQCALGKCYIYGNGVELDVDSAVKMFLKAALQNHTEAQYMLGVCCEHGFVDEEYDNAAEWYEKAAEKGLAEAQYNLGLYYEGIGPGIIENGNEIEQDFNKAVKWYEKAAAQGVEGAQFRLARCYYYGYGVEQDYTKAVKWYACAAKQGYAEAQHSLGFCYAFAKGVPENYAEAVEWFKKAASQGYANSQFNLGYCYYNGLGVPENFSKSIEWYNKAAEQGHAGAQFNLGICYLKVQKISKAIAWLKKAAEQGHEGARGKLADLSEE